MRKSVLRRSAALVAVAVSVVALAACSSGGSSGGSSSGASGASGTVPAALYQGTFTAPPSSGPSPSTGKTVWIVSCGQNSIGCQTGANSAQQAANLIGWKASVCDGKLNAGGAWTTCVRQGIAAKPDAIITEAIDCVAIKPALQEAKAANIPVIDFWGFDCDDPTVNAGPKLFTASTEPSSTNPTNADYQTAIGKARAQWVIGSSGGKAKVIEIDFQGTSIGHYLHQGFADQMKTCSGCTVYDVPVTLQSLNNLRSTVQSALLKHPDATYVASPLDSLVLLGVGPAVSGSSNRAKIKVIGGEGLPPNLDLIRSGSGENAAVAQPVAWWGYAAIDTTNRVLHGGSAVPEGLGLALVDSTHNLPTSGAYQPSIDFVSLYKKLWAAG